MSTNNPIAVLRIKEAYFGEPITSKDAIATTSFTTKAPMHFDGDEVGLFRDKPEKFEIGVHESDSPIYITYDGVPYKYTGSFTSVTKAQMAELLGGEATEGGVELSADVKRIHKSVKLVMSDGSVIVVPNAQGFVTMSGKIGKKSVVTFPFEFECLGASTAWNVAMGIYDKDPSTV
ncbi:hypothetical protein QYZ87_06720 [Porphyromonadaceae bacterium W3.11]|nr:hypothetical protein [Porphyromonadaceae bacterium W3.11]MDN4753425.1 hypothetical protein [Porphyromonadaceae bacterium W3.11]MDN4753625.1 hypothetical protein [Porphyromonadaceae bacterium W3.11]MDN4754218.1 hypothetical protein [Porphyromonadaceae bacterium W3.11]